MYNAQYSVQVLHIHDPLKHDFCKGVVCCPSYIYSYMQKRLTHRTAKGLTRSLGRDSQHRKLNLYKYKIGMALHANTYSN